jgi:hypothetical protein
VQKKTHQNKKKKALLLKEGLFLRRTTASRDRITLAGRLRFHFSFCRCGFSGKIFRPCRRESAVFPGMAVIFSRSDEKLFCLYLQML